MRDFIVGVLVFVAVVILASELGVAPSTVGQEAGEAVRFGFTAISGFFTGVFSG